ncbi:hypothetical protein F4678DRAFT_464067 [Xylaria arbuscula]|nr:hypothetical protein F4678DRAFT_464067 [Xylaria arbuscula]
MVSLNPEDSLAMGQLTDVGSKNKDDLTLIAVSMATSRGLMTNTRPKPAVELARDIFHAHTGQPTHNATRGPPVVGGLQSVIWRIRQCGLWALVPHGLSGVTTLRILAFSPRLIASVCAVQSTVLVFTMSYAGAGQLRGDAEKLGSVEEAMTSKDDVWGELASPATYGPKSYHISLLTRPSRYQQTGGQHECLDLLLVASHLIHITQAVTGHRRKRKMKKYFHKLD